MNEEHAKDVLLEFLHEHYSQLRHYELQRSTVSNLLVIIAAAILAFVTFDKALTIADLPLTVLLFVIGLFGAAFCLKYYERSARYYDRIKATRDMLDQVVFGGSVLGDLRNEANAQHDKEFPVFHGGKLSWVKVYRLWIIFHVFIALLGLILTILIYFV
jgi:hypothetical protein